MALNGIPSVYKEDDIGFSQCLYGFEASLQKLTKGILCRCHGYSDQEDQKIGGFNRFETDKAIY